MAEIEKRDGITTHEERDELAKLPVAKTKVVSGDEAYEQAMVKEPPNPWSQASLLLYLVSVVGFFCSTTNGYDGSLFGTLLINPDFKAFFQVENDGIWAGIVTSMYQIGSVVAIPIIGPAIDTWGRRGGMFIAASIIFIGVVIQGTCVATGSVGQFMGGRFLLGFGVAIIGSAGPCYVVEISHPAYRGVVTGLYNVFWPVGALVASGACRGGLNYAGNVSWQIPVWLQGMFPGLLIIFCWFLPESPRWLYVNGKATQSKSFLTKYHGNGNENSAWVSLQIWEYETHLELDGADKRWWDYRALFKNRASVYRLTCNCFVSLFGQWAGNSVVTYYLSAFLDIAGIKEGVAQNNIQLGMNALQIFMACVGAMFVDRIGRRPMLLWTNVACALCWVGVCAAAATQVNSGGTSTAASQATIAMVYLFQICYSFGWTPLQALYPVEVLSYEMRAKGMAFSNLFVSVGGLVNQFGMPEAIKQITWKLYIVFIVWNLCQAAILYFLVPETKNRTLEELDAIFNAPSPRKAASEKKTLGLDENSNVVTVSGREELRV